jgi:hypothetical protein
MKIRINRFGVNFRLMGFAEENPLPAARPPFRNHKSLASLNRRSPSAPDEARKPREDIVFGGGCWCLSVRLSSL